jgi:rhodanese-related sulfurtransferase
MKMKSLLLLVVIGSFLVSACSAGILSANFDGTDNNRKYVNVTHEELNDMVQDKDFILINVHIPYEGNIPQTDISIPYNQISENISQLPKEKDAKIVVYCRSGSMSAVAADKLVSMGYTNVFNLEGGFFGWADAGLPME